VSKVDPISPWQDLPRAPTSSVIPGEDVEAWNSGFGFLKAAQARAQMIATAAGESGYKKGYQDGLREGYNAVAKLIATATAQVSKYVNSIDGQVIEAVLAATRSVLGSIPDRELVARAATHAIDARLRTASHVTVKVHPDAVSEVRAAIQQVLAAHAGSNARITVEGDASLPSPLSIELHAPSGVVNAGIGPQLSALERTMRMQPGKASR